MNQLLLTIKRSKKMLNQRVEHTRKQGLVVNKRTGNLQEPEVRDEC